jgi:hypothetical protein
MMNRGIPRFSLSSKKSVEGNKMEN